MYITFYNKNKKWGGIANNGGSRTVLLSADILRSQGCGVSIVSNSDRFTWFPHPPIVHSVPKNTDVVVAVSISDVSEIMRKFPDKKLAYWARPFEIWQMPEEKCIKTLFKFYRSGGIIMVNSGWQKTYLEQLHGIKCHLIYSGQDIECEFKKPDYDPNDGFPLTIGCQYSSKPRKGWKEFKKIAKILGDKYDYVAFGSEKCKAGFLSEYLRNPSRNELNALYRRMDVFYIGNQLEGYLNVGSEATINGCLLICNNNPRCGAHDYCNEETAHMYSYGNAEYQISDIVKNLDFSKVSKCQDIIRNTVGTRLENMQKMVDILKA